MRLRTLSLLLIGAGLAGAFALGRAWPAATPTGPAIPVSAPAVVAAAPTAPAAETTLAGELTPAGVPRFVNPAQAIVAEFHDDGMHGTAERADGSTAAWRMHLTGYGYGAAMTTPGATRPQLFDDYLEYRRGDIIEWYVNRANGLEQGFTVVAPPQGGTGAETLDVTVAVESEYAMRLLPGGDAMALVDASGEAVMTYADVVALDADGKRLPIALSLCDARTLRFSVNDREAVYPVTIDPIFRQGGVSPVLEGVDDNGDGTFTARWGWLNPGTQPRHVPAARNFFSPAPRDRGQPTTFAPGRVRNAFSTVFDGGNLVWTLAGRTAAASGAAAPDRQRVSPVLEYVQQLADGTYVAHFGYLNLNHRAVTIPAGARNSFHPAPQDRGQTTVFQVGRVVGSFQVPFTGGTIVWSLTGPDGRRRTATASAEAAIPYQWAPVRPVLEYVLPNHDGTWRAVFGYQNENPVAVTIPAGSRNRFSPLPQDRGQTTEFQPGRVVAAFWVDFAGGNLVWTLTSPDGSTRTATAGVGGPGPVGLAVRPVLERVYDLGGEYLAVFGYKSDYTHPVRIPPGALNRFTPTPQDRGQPTDYLPGRQLDVFTVRFAGGTLVWTLTSPDGGTRSATAGAGAATPWIWAPVRPVLEVVHANGDGSYTAEFGYRNDNPFAVTIPVGSDNRFSPSPADRGQDTVFAPGRQVRTFAVDFSGGNLVWVLRGPDGRTRSATAGTGAAVPRAVAMVGAR